MFDKPLQPTKLGKHNKWIVCRTQPQSTVREGPTRCAFLESKKLRSRVSGPRRITILARPVCALSTQAIREPSVFEACRDGPSFAPFPGVRLGLSSQRNTGMRLETPLQLIAYPKEARTVDDQLDQKFFRHHTRAAMMLSRSRIDPRPHDPLYGYRDLSHFICEGFNEPLNQTDLYLRLLAASKAERTALPTLGHMQALMSMVWDNNIVPAKYEPAFLQVCHQVSESLCYDIGKYATESMKNIAATLRVDLQVQMGYEQDEPPAITAPQKPPASPDGPEPATAAEESKAAVPIFEAGKPTIH